MNKKKLKKMREKMFKIHEFSVNLGVPTKKMIAGFPIRENAINQLWDWNSLQNVKLK